jgi:hypothetical protein
LANVKHLRRIVDALARRVRPRPPAAIMILPDNGTGDDLPLELRYHGGAHIVSGEGLCFTCGENHLAASAAPLTPDAPNSEPNADPSTPTSQKG